jgi:hypothetical protein
VNGIVHTASFCKAKIQESVKIQESAEGKKIPKLQKMAKFEMALALVAQCVKGLLPR